MENQPLIVQDPISQPQPVTSIPPCSNTNYQFKKHGCPYCTQRSVHPHVINAHIEKKHPESPEAKAIEQKKLEKERSKIIEQKKMRSQERSFNPHNQ